jgi:hypothetical protein
MLAMAKVRHRHEQNCLFVSVKENFSSFLSCRFASLVSTVLSFFLPARKVAAVAAAPVLSKLAPANDVINEVIAAEIICILGIRETQMLPPDGVGVS